MDSLESIFAAAQSTEPPVIPLQQMIRLPSTDMLAAVLEGAQQRSSRDAFGRFEDRVQFATRRLLAGHARDRIQATRPAGCWCLGVGGKDELAVSTGKVVHREYCSCPEGIALKDVEKEIIQEAHEAETAKLVAHVWERAEIPERFSGLRLSGHPLNKTSPALIARLSRARMEVHGDDGFEAHFAQWWNSWYFWGDFGVGKTGLAVGFARECLETLPDETTIFYRSEPDLLTELRSTYGRQDGIREDDLLKKYAAVDILILDELGRAQDTGSGWLSDRMYQIIGKRHASKKITVFTSNLSVSAVGKKWKDQAIAWRIIEMCGDDHIVHVQGANLRDTKARPGA